MSVGTPDAQREAETSERGTIGGALSLDAAALGRVGVEAYPGAGFVASRIAALRPRICPFDAVIVRTRALANELGRPLRVLDVGCGIGSLLALLHADGLVERGVGFDVSPDAIAEANTMTARTKAPLAFHALGAEGEWPAAEETFDLVTMVDVMHHLPTAIREESVVRACDRAGVAFLYKDMARTPLWMRAMNRLHDLVMAREWIDEEAIEQVEWWAHERGMRVAHAEDIHRLWYAHELRVFKRTELVDA
ncbi:MAG: class I SAM-dependent methyltransferase [Planctomycetota bacterium]